MTDGMAFVIHEALSFIAVCVTTYVAIQIKKVHTAVNSERTAMIAKVESLHRVILDMTERAKEPPPS